MPITERNVAQQVVQSVEVVYSSDPGNPDSTSTLILAGPAVRIIDYIDTVQARELVVVAQAAVAMTMTIELVSFTGISDVLVATIALLPGVPTPVVITGLLTGARVSVALAGVAAGRVEAAAYSRA